jgi:hypothetical protein
MLSSLSAVEKVAVVAQFSVFSQLGQGTQSLLTLLAHGWSSEDKTEREHM